MRPRFGKTLAKFAAMVEGSMPMPLTCHSPAAPCRRPRARSTSRTVATHPIAPLISSSFPMPFGTLSPLPAPRSTPDIPAPLFVRRHCPAGRRSRPAAAGRDARGDPGGRRWASAAPAPPRPRQRDQEQAEHALRGRGGQRRRQQRHVTAHSVRPRVDPRRGEQDLRAATDSSDQLAGFSNFGATNVDLAAPGVDVLSTVPHEHLLQRQLRDADHRPLDDQRRRAGGLRAGTRTTLFSTSPDNSITDSPSGRATT